MKISILFGQRKETYDWEYGPEVLVAWDEYSIDENPDGFEKECDKAKYKYEAEMAAMRVIEIEVDGDKIRDLLMGRSVVPGKIL